MARRIILIIIALLVSGGAIFLAQQWLRASGSAARPGPLKLASNSPPPPAMQVLVAKSDLYAGQFIRPDSLVWQSWPSGPVPDAYLVQGKANPQDLVGAVVRSRVTQGQPITLSGVVRPGDRGFMAAVLTPGERAVTVNVTPATGIAGFVFPGDHVDVILTMSLQPTSANDGPNGAGQSTGVTRHVSETILRDVRVVGMDQAFTDGRKDDKADLSVAKTATLELSAKQAEIIAVAGDMGVMSLALRSLARPEGEPVVSSVTKTWDTEATQIALAVRSGAKPEKPKPYSVNIVHGSAAVEATLPGFGPTGRVVDQ
jgi:pilus assembly protein CpaB